MTPALREKRIHDLFYVGIILKGLNAIIEILLGITLFFSSHYAGFLQTLIQSELVEDPTDFFARHADQLSSYLTPHIAFYAGLYLVSHGIVKGFIIWGLLRGKLWAYPAGLAVFALFIAYQVVKWFDTHSWVLLALTVFDLLIMWLIWHEYRRAERLRV